MGITKIVPCKADPDREFVFADEKPGKIAVHSIGGQGRYWFSREHIVKTIEGFEANLAFWHEMLETLEGDLTS